MFNNINKHLLSQFYGLNEDGTVPKFVSSSKGIESFENVTDLECLSSEYLHSSEETGKNQNTEEESEKVSDENNENSLSKSPHILTVKELIEETEKVEDSQDSQVEADIIDDLQDDKNVPTKNFTKLEDTFTKALAKLSESPVQVDANSIGDNLSSTLSSSPVKKAKKLWRQKTMLSKEHLLTPANILLKFNGTYLDLNNMGICAFPVEILEQLSGLQMLYLDSNNLKEIPAEFFTTLKYLKWLDVRNNQLTSVPTSIKGHAYLETLLLQGNNIEKLPLELGLVPNLKNLQIAHNPLTLLPREILDSDCSEIINFLRKEWNANHPTETIGLRKIKDEKVEKKPSTIICYQPVSKRSFNSNRYKNFQNTPKTSVRSRTLKYKPSNRCHNNGDDIFEQKMIWMEIAKKLLSEQMIHLQRSADKKVLEKWRHDYRCSKSRKYNVKRLSDAPFALHTECSVNDGVNHFKSRFSYINFRNFDQNLDEFIKSLEKLDDARMSGNMTPHTEQKQLQAEIEKITELQKKLHDLKFCNDSILTSDKKTDNSKFVKYIPPPSIII